MRLTPVYMHDHSGEDGIEVFKSESEARAYIKDDIDNVTKILEDDGYEGVVVEKATGYEWEVYVPDSGIYYEWRMYECTLR